MNTFTLFGVRSSRPRQVLAPQRRTISRGVDQHQQAREQVFSLPGQSLNLIMNEYYEEEEINHAVNVAIMQSGQSEAAALSNPGQNLPNVVTAGPSLVGIQQPSLLGSPSQNDCA